MLKSPSMRRVWIEIENIRGLTRPNGRHPPRGGCGLKYYCIASYDDVATSPSTRRVWIEIPAAPAPARRPPSPSTRRVWIEIPLPPLGRDARCGHPPRGGCGLKSFPTAWVFLGFQSPSTRRVWIEMSLLRKQATGQPGHPPRGGCGLKCAFGAGAVVVSHVTLHAEGVD